MKYTYKKFNELSGIEVYEILKLRNEVFIVEQECPYMDCDDKDQEAYHLMIKDEENLIAYLRILNKGVSYDEMSIGRVIVKESHRGKKIAKNMLEDALKFIGKTFGKEDVRISAQSYAINLYKEVGFEVVSDEYLEDDIPHKEMLYRG